MWKKLSDAFGGLVDATVPSQRGTSRKLEKTGTHAKAEVLELALTNRNWGHEGLESETVWNVTLHVEPEDEPSFELKTGLRFFDYNPPVLGTITSVIYDPKHRSKIMLDYDAQPPMPEHWAGPSRKFADTGPGFEALQAAREGRTGPGSQVMRLVNDGQLHRVASGPGPDDEVALLEYLAAKYARGELTQAAFERQKQEILAR